MKVVQFLPALNIGGVERGVIDLSRALVSHGHESIVISSGGSNVATIEKDGGKHYSLPPFSIWKLREIYENEKPDIVHIRSWKPAWTNYFAYGLIKQKPILVSTFHSMYQYPFLSQAMARVDHMIAVSNVVKEYILSSYTVDPDNITTIYRGCDPLMFNKTPLSQAWLDAWYQEFPQTKNKKILLLPARLARWKGSKCFIDMIQGLKEDHSIHGLIVGPVKKSKQYFHTELQNKIHSHGLQDRITFTGGRNDIANIYKLSDIAYNLSLTPEPFGRTTIEAISCGAQLIGWNHGGTKEILTSLFPQGLVPVQDIPSLIKTTRYLLDNPDIKPADNTFLSSKMATETMHLYAKLMNK